MLKIPYDEVNDITHDSEKSIRGMNKQRYRIGWSFGIRYDVRRDRGERYRVIAGCRNFSIEEACNHWLSPEHHSYKKRTKTLRKLFKLYKVEKRRIPKLYRGVLGY